MKGTRTPGTLYAVRQNFSTLAWQVVPVDAKQGTAWRERGEPHVYDTSRQAYAIAKRLNEKRAQPKENP